MSLTGLTLNNNSAGTKFFHPDLSSAGVLGAINLAGAAYATTEEGLSGFDLGTWEPITINLTAAEFGLDSTLVENDLFYQSATFPSSGLDFIFPGTAEAIVFENTVTSDIALAFRGTAGGVPFITGDAGDWGPISQQLHYAAFGPLFEALDDYLVTNSVDQLLVTGHSLGGAMVEFYMDDYSDGTLPGIEYEAVAVASPQASFTSDSRVLNIGHESDIVYSVVGSRGLNAVKELNAVFDENFFGDIADVGNQHSIGVSYRWTAETLLGSQFYSETTRDSSVIVSMTDEVEELIEVATNIFFDEPALVLGRNRPLELEDGSVVSEDDFLVGGAADDFLEGFAGDDILQGDVVLFGDGGDDTMAGGSGADLFLGTPGQLNNDTIVDLEIGDRVGLSGETVEQEDVSFTSSAVVIDADDGFFDFFGSTISINATVPVGASLRVLDETLDDGGSIIEVVAAAQGINLISGLGGTAGFGEQLLGRNDDGSTGFVDISSIFEDGIDFFGREFSGLWVNNNGSVTFNGPRFTFTPDVITSNSGNPEITPYFADVDTEGGAVSPTLGGNSTGSNLVYYDFDAINDRFIVTWDDVSYFNSHTDKLNAFQLILTDQGSGDFDIEFRYEDVNWTTGDFSGGSGGLGGTVARAGYTAGTGDPAAFFELPTSGDQSAMLALDETQGNTGDIGRWEFNVRSGDVVTSNIPPLPPIGTNGWINGDPHISTLDGIGYDFQAAGEFILLHGTSDLSFEIQGRMIPIGNDVSVISAVATNLGGTAVMVDAQDAIPLHVAGAATTITNFSFIDVGNDRVFREDDTYTIVYAGADNIVNAGDSRLIVDVRGERVDIDVRLNTDMAGDLEGLFGDGDGNTANDIALADGTVLDRPLAFDVLYGQYRDDWRVSDIAESLFTYDTGESLAGFYQPDYPGSLVTLDDLDPLVREAAELAVLNAGLTPGTANFNNAVLDFSLTGDSSFITSSLEAPSISESNVVTVVAPPPPPPPLFNEIFGTAGRDNLIGTSADDKIISLSGSFDRMSGGDGADVFVVGAETVNGVRERDIILDYEVGVDSIMLEDGATIGAIRQTSSGVAVFLEGDGDAIYVQGEGVLVGSLTFIPEDIVFD